MNCREHAIKELLKDRRVLKCNSGLNSDRLHEIAHDIARHLYPQHVTFPSTGIFKAAFREHNDGTLVYNSSTKRWYTREDFSMPKNDQGQKSVEELVKESFENVAARMAENFLEGEMEQLVTPILKTLVKKEFDEKIVPAVMTNMNAVIDEKCRHLESKVDELEILDVVKETVKLELATMFQEISENLT